MEVDYLIDQLKANGQIFQSIFQGLTSEQYNWKPQEIKIWSLKEILCHLHDEERLDFKPRIQSVIEQRIPAPIDPESWVQEYADRSYEASLIALLDEREDSINFVKRITTEEWKMSFQIPDTDINRTSRFYLDNWLTHDLLHIRQATKVRYLYTSSKSINEVAYAGKWVL